MLRRVVRTGHLNEAEELLFNITSIFAIGKQDALYLIWVSPFRLTATARCRRGMSGLSVVEAHTMFLQELLVSRKLRRQVLFGDFSFPSTRGHWRARDTLDAGLDAVHARFLSVTLDFPLLAQGARMAAGNLGRG